MFLSFFHKHTRTVHRHKNSLFGKMHACIRCGPVLVEQESPHTLNKCIPPATFRSFGLWLVLVHDLDHHSHDPKKIKKMRERRPKVGEDCERPVPPERELELLLGVEAIEYSPQFPNELLFEISVQHRRCTVMVQINRRRDLVCVVYRSSHPTVPTP